MKPDSARYPRNNETPTGPVANPHPDRAVYRTPALLALGDLRLLTLGSSPGATESGPGGFVHKPEGT